MVNWSAVFAIQNTQWRRGNTRDKTPQSITRGGHMLPEFHAVFAVHPLTPKLFVWAKMFRLNCSGCNWPGRPVHGQYSTGPAKYNQIIHV
jgi:hypothetical protein